MGPTQKSEPVMTAKSEPKLVSVKPQPTVEPAAPVMAPPTGSRVRVGAVSASAKPLSVNVNSVAIRIARMSFMSVSLMIDNFCLLKLIGARSRSGSESRVGGKSECCREAGGCNTSCEVDRGVSSSGLRYSQIPDEQWECGKTGDHGSACGARGLDEGKCINR